MAYTAVVRVSDATDEELDLFGGILLARHLGDCKGF